MYAGRKYFKAEGCRYLDWKAWAASHRMGPSLLPTLLSPLPRCGLYNTTPSAKSQPQPFKTNVISPSGNILTQYRVGCPPFVREPTFVASQMATTVHPDPRTPTICTVQPPSSSSAPEQFDPHFHVIHDYTQCIHERTTYQSTITALYSAVVGLYQIPQPEVGTALPTHLPLLPLRNCPPATEQYTQYIPYIYI